jgi:hypothetical protein
MSIWNEIPLWNCQTLFCRRIQDGLVS